jgi:ADP-dependent NAD(P)H-hydrate dehydratase / NAD(P)H-hydrate epimerase
VYDTLQVVLSPEEMRLADRETIDEFGVPGFTLMETAGRVAARISLEMLGDSASRRVICLAGKGNNGGDGFVMSRVLSESGCELTVVLTSDPETLSGDALSHFRLLDVLSREGGHVRIERLSEGLPDGPTDIYVDALIGTGLRNDVEGPLAGLISDLNARHTPVLSIDIPSGLNADTGRIMGVCVRASQTVTMGALKTGLLTGSGPDVTGTVEVAEIGIPAHIIREINESGSGIRYCTPEAVDRILPDRDRSSTKYTSGPTLVFGGSEEFPGAAVLSSIAAARIGSGYVMAVCPPKIEDLLKEKLTEIPTSAWELSSGSPDAMNTLERLGDRWSRAKAILVGPGVGRATGTCEFVRTILRESVSPAVVDADGLFALIGERSFVSERSGGKWVFTPHAGEFSRMEDEKSEGQGLIERAKRFASQWNVVLLLKGMPSITVAPDGRTVINDTGSGAAGTAGTGDVLAGMVAGLIAQGQDPFDAAVSGVHLAGRLVDRYTEEHAARSMMASDVLDMIPELLSSPSRMHGLS